MTKTRFFGRYMSRVFKTDKNGNDSKFHGHDVTSNFDTCFKNVPYVTIGKKT